MNPTFTFPGVGIIRAGQRYTRSDLSSTTVLGIENGRTLLDRYHGRELYHCKIRVRGCVKLEVADLSSVCDAVVAVS